MRLCTALLWSVSIAALILICACRSTKSTTSDGFLNYRTSSFTAIYEFESHAAGHTMTAKITWSRAAERANRLDAHIVEDGLERDVTAITAGNLRVMCRAAQGAIECFDAGVAVSAFHPNPTIIEQVGISGHFLMRSVAGLAARCSETNPPADECFSAEGVPVYSTDITRDAVSLFVGTGASATGITSLSPWLAHAGGVLQVDTVSPAVNEAVFDAPAAVRPFPGLSLSTPVP